MVVKIDNYDIESDLFTFPYNPKSYDSNIEANVSISDYAFSNNIILSANGTRKPKEIVLNGHFSGEERWTNYRKLAKHFGENNVLKKLYFEADKFMLGIGLTLQKTHNNDRVNFIDYVFMFKPISSILFGDTLKSSGVNGGNCITPIMEITGTIVNGSNNVEISDGIGGSLVLSSDNFETGDYFRYSFVKFLGTGGENVKTTEYGVVEIGVDVAGVVNYTQKRTSSVIGLLSLGINKDVSTISITNISTPVVKFRDGWVN